MSKEILENYKELLFSDNIKTYAIADSLRDEKLRDKLIVSKSRFENLWHSSIVDDTNSVPLYLIELKEDDNLVNYLIEQHSKNLVIYFQSPYSMEKLREFYSSFTLLDIELEEDTFKESLFGFYDPLVFSNYVKTLYSQEKVEEFFQPSLAWFVPNSKKENECNMHYINDIEEVKSLKLEIDEKSKSTFENLEIIDLNKSANIDFKERREINHKQMLIFEQLEKEQFVSLLLEEYKEDGYVFDDFEDETLKEFALKVYDEAHGINIRINTEAGLYRYILISILLGKSINSIELYLELRENITLKQKVELLDKVLNLLIERMNEKGIV
jgi:hypothetical protein